VRLYQEGNPLLSIWALYVENKTWTNITIEHDPPSLKLYIIHPGNLLQFPPGLTSPSPAIPVKHLGVRKIRELKLGLLVHMVRLGRIG